MSQFWPVDELIAAIGPWEGRTGPLYARLADALADAIHQATVDGGARLPSERVLAERLQVARGTVVAAYAALAERGVVERRRGSGTTVAGAARAAPGPLVRYPLLNRIVSGPDVPIDLSVGAPHLDALAAGLGADAALALAGGAPSHGYVPLGLPVLRSGIADLLCADGVATGSEQVLVTPGAQGALTLLTQALVRRGDRVVVETPTWPGAMELFSRAGAAMIGVRRDHAGPRPDDLERVLATEPPAFVFLIPTCHNPTGSIMPEARRRELLAVCRRHEVLVIEDATTAQLVFDGETPPALAALDPEVVSVGSFSKVLWGGLRIGWLRGDPALVLRLGRLKAIQDLGCGLLDQAACAAALPRLGELVAERRAMARARHAHVVAALAERLPDWRVAPCRGGYSLWIGLPDAVADDLVAAALRHGVALSSGASSAPDDLFLDHVRLCFSAPPAVLDEAVDRLATAWDEVAAAGRPRARVAV